MEWENNLEAMGTNKQITRVHIIDLTVVRLE